MFFLYYFFQIFLLLKYSTSTQLCVDNCQVEYDLYGTFILPTNCSMTQRDYCYILTIFDYVQQTIKVEFNADFDTENVNGTDIKIKSVFSLEEPVSIEHLIGYSCSTGDHCDIEYIQNLTVQRSAPDACQRLRSQFIDYLDPSPLSTERDCYIDEQTISKCQRPCEFIYKNPNEISRSCNGNLELMFEMIIEKSKLANQSTDLQRTWSFSCTTSNCNGKQMQDEIENLINLNRKLCFFSFDDDQPTTTNIPLKAQSVSFHLIMIFICISLIFIL